VKERVQVRQDVQVKENGVWEKQVTLVQVLPSSS
jgi:hypothetical protein